LQVSEASLQTGTVGTGSCGREGHADDSMPRSSPAGFLGVRQPSRMASRQAAIAPSTSPFSERAAPRLMWAEPVVGLSRIASWQAATAPSTSPLRRRASPRLEWAKG
jgi:hypothetical protein